MPARTFVGSVLGYCVGEFIKKFSKKIAVYAGGAFTFLGLLAYNDWISINWRKIDRDLVNLMFRGTRTATGLFSYFQRIFIHAIPISGGFYLGFHYSVRKSLPSFV